MSRQIANQGKIYEYYLKSKQQLQFFIVLILWATEELKYWFS